MTCIMIAMNPRRPVPPAAAQRGFTLLEMIVVLVIIGLIMGLIGPRLFGQADKAKVQTAQTQVKMLKGALETMRLDIGRFPTREEGLGLLVDKPADAGLASRWAWTAPCRRILGATPTSTAPNPAPTSR